MSDELEQVFVLMGPYRDHYLTMPKSEATSAINDHWAIEPPRTAPADDDHPHPPLTEQERKDAYTAAITWAEAQWNPQPPPTEPPEPPEVKRDMKPAAHHGGYETRDAAKRK